MKVGENLIKLWPKKC